MYRPCYNCDIFKLESCMLVLIRVETHQDEGQVNYKKKLHPLGKIASIFLSHNFQ